jgi:uncharacterized protein YnzC (UPF0291/DUF896 family)
METRKILSSSLKGSSIEAIERRGSLLEKRYNLKDTAVKSTNFHYWKQKGFLHTIDNNKKASLSLVECIWIEILISLKNFGCSAKTMEMAFKALFLDAYAENLAKKFNESHINYFKDLKKLRPLTAEEEMILAVRNQIANDKLLADFLSRDITYLYNMIIETLEKNAETGLIITEDGKCNRYYIFPNNTPEENPEYNNSPHVKIPIAHYLKKFIEDDTKAESLNKTGVLTDNELTVVKEMRNNNIRSIKVHFRHDEHTIEKIEVEEKGLLSKAVSKEIMGIMGMKNYNKIELNTRDGHQLSFTRTTKKYF